MSEPSNSKSGAGTLLRIRAAVAITAACLAMLPAQAGELDTIKERLVEARSQDDVAAIYAIVDREFQGDTTKIVAFLKETGFSCTTAVGFVSTHCEFAYCGDRPFFPLLFRRELMVVAIWIRNNKVSYSVAHLQTACPATDAALKQKQKQFLKGSR